VAFYADFGRGGRGEINHLYGGRGVYFDDPNGHLFELITQPYGPVPERWAETGGPARVGGRVPSIVDAMRSRAAVDRISAEDPRISRAVPRPIC
jgi:hypothetical protein